MANMSQETNEHFAFEALYERPFPSSRSGPLFNAFSYPTKISPEVIAVFIATHTSPGGVVLDTFAGSGSTGIAAKLCDSPTNEMLSIASLFNLKPIWGPRHAILYELGVIGSFVADVMCSPPEPSLFEAEAASLVSDAHKRLGPLLTTKDDDGHEGVFRHIIWSELLECTHCGHQHGFWDVAVTQAPLALRSADAPYPCPSCKENLTLKSVKRATTVVYDDLLERYVEQRVRVPVRIYGTTGKRRWQRPVTAEDLNDLRKIAKIPIPQNAPIAELRLGDLYRSGYHFGLTHLHHLYTRRNLICIATLFELIEQRHESVRDALRLLVLSYNQSHATLMSRVVVKNGQGDFVLTGAQSGVLYISSLPVEKNVIEGVSRKVKHLKAAFELVSGSKSTVVVNNQSSTRLKEAQGTVDYVFTDPPFGDYIPYSEINQVNELWLGKRTDCREEAIISASQGKTVDQYQSLMTSVFSEVSRVLRPAGKATVVFHAAKARVWAALQHAYRSAGFEVSLTSVLDKLQASFKQTVSNVSVKGDPLLLLTKTELRVGAKREVDMILHELLLSGKNSLDPAELEPRRMYSRYVSKCLEEGSSVELDAEQFYAILQEKFLS